MQTLGEESLGPCIVTCLAMLGFVLLCLAQCACGMPQMDARTTAWESDWFHALSAMDDLQEYCKQWSGQRCWHCLDLFSRSRNFERQFEKNGFTATSYDVLNNPLQDITTRAGFLVLLNLGLQFLDDESSGV